MPFVMAVYIVSLPYCRSRSFERTRVDVLRALLIGYEIIAKLAKCFKYENLKLHGRTSLAAIGAAAAIGTLKAYSEMIFQALIPLQHWLTRTF